MNKSFHQEFNSPILKPAYQLVAESADLNDKIITTLTALENMGVMLETAFEDISTLQTLRKTLSDKKVTAVSLEQSSLFIQNICQRQGMVFRPRYFAVESNGNSNYAVEGVGDFLKSIWDAIIKAIGRMLDWVKNLFSGGSDGHGGVTKAVENDLKAIDASVESIKKKKEKPAANVEYSLAKITSCAKILNELQNGKDLKQSLIDYSKHTEDLVTGIDSYFKVVHETADVPAMLEDVSKKVKEKLSEDMSSEQRKDIIHSYISKADEAINVSLFQMFGLFPNCKKTSDLVSVQAGPKKSFIIFWLKKSTTKHGLDTLGMGVENNPNEVYSISESELKQFISGTDERFFQSQSEDVRKRKDIIDKIQKSAIAILTEMKKTLESESAKQKDMNHDYHELVKHVTVKTLQAIHIHFRLFGKVVETHKKYSTILTRSSQLYENLV